MCVCVYIYIYKETGEKVLFLRKCTSGKSCPSECTAALYPW